MGSQSISIAARGGRGAEAYLAVPEAGSGPGLVLFHDISDKDGDLHELTELYADEGYVTLCPKAFAIANGAEDLLAVVGSLRSRSECTGRVGALGFGLGGKLACLAAAEAMIDCAISYYGFGIDFGLNLAPRIGRPLALHFAELDPQIPPEAVARIKKSFAGRSAAAIYVYSGAAPGFDRKAGPNYNRAAASLAHMRSIALLRRVIGP